MKTDVPTPYGFDIWDPRIQIRRAAAEAQARASFETATEDVPVQEPQPGDVPEHETVEAGWYYG